MTETLAPTQEPNPAAKASFLALGLNAAIVDAIARCGYESPTPIQRDAVPLALAGRDVLGQAETGSGKTGAYLWPMIQRLLSGQTLRKPRALVLCPTRELAVQVYDSFLRYQGGLRLKPVLCVGGVPSEAQALDIMQGCDAVVGTPGRLTELVLADALDLRSTKCVVLDEADRLLELGFFTETRRLLRATAADRQTLFFSATLESGIGDWAGTILRDPVRVEATPPGRLVPSIREAAVRLNPSAKAAAIAALIHGGLDDGSLSVPTVPAKVLVFVNHRRAVDALAEYLQTRGLTAGRLHGGRTQTERQAALDEFRADPGGLLIATDVAARGLEIPGVTLVVNAELPVDALEYVHRSGRTARMGRDGLSVSLVSDEEVPALRKIEELTGRKIPVTGIMGFDPKGDHPAVMTAAWGESGDGSKPKSRKGSKPGKRTSGSSTRRQTKRPPGNRKPAQPEGDKPKAAARPKRKPAAKSQGTKSTAGPASQGAAKSRNQSRLARKSSPSKGGKLKVVSRGRRPSK